MLPFDLYLAMGPVISPRAVVAFDSGALQLRVFNRWLIVSRRLT